MAKAGTLPDADWSPQALCYYFECLPRGQAAHDLCHELEWEHKFSTDANLEVRAAYLARAVEADLEEIFDAAFSLLEQTGRMKYLKALYRALKENPKTHDRAREAFARLRPTYQHHAAAAIERLLAA